MESFANLTSSISDIVSTFIPQEFWLFCFFCLGFIIFRSETLRRCLRGCRKQPQGKVSGIYPIRRLRDDFKNARYEQVLDGWSCLEKYTIEGLSFVLNSLMAMGRPEDTGVLVAKTAANLPHLKTDLDKVVAAVARPSCEVRRQHISAALRDIYEQARSCLDVSAVKELLLGLANHNDEMRVAGLLGQLADLKSPASPELLSILIQKFLGCKNLDAALGYLQQVLASPNLQADPQSLVLEVVKVSAEAVISDDSTTGGARPRVWDAIDALQGTSISDEVVLVFLEWAARQAPVDVAMAETIERKVRKARPLPFGAYDALVRIHAGTSRGLDFFNELVQASENGGPTEMSLVGMISSCVEGRNGALAEHMLNWARTNRRCTLSIFSSTVKVLAASKQSTRICIIYESVMRQEKLSIDEELQTQVMNAAVHAGRLELARSLFGRTQQPSQQNYMSLMRACAQEGKVDQALQLLRELQNAGEVDTVTYNCALDICASCGNHTLAKRVLKDMKTAGRVDVVSYNIMLKLCMSEGASPRAAGEVLLEMRQRGLHPNTATYNSLLGGALAAGDFNKAWRTIDQMEAAKLNVDAYTLSILFKGYKNERRTMDAESIDYALGLVQKHSVKVDEVLVNVALEACIAVRDVQRVKQAMATFKASGWVLSKNASMHTYGVLIKAQGLCQNVNEAWRLWREVTVENGSQPSEQLYGQMLDVLVNNNYLEEALKLFQQMKAIHSQTLDSQGFAVAYAMIIRGFAQRKNCSMALRCYEEMKGNGTKASLVVLNTLIDACSRVGDMEAAARLFQDMLTMDVVPDLITYSTLIKGYCISNELDQAFQLFTLMQKKGIRPDAIVFNSLLDGCAKKQMPSLCEQVIRDMEKAGVVPSNHSASILIKLYGRCKNLDAAFKVVDEMPRKYGFRPNNPVYTCLMSACISNGRLDRAMELRERMVRENIYPDEKTYSTLLRGTLRVGSVEQCVLLLNAALDQKRSPNSSARSLLDTELVKSSLILIRRRNLWDVHGREIFERLRENGVSVRMPGDGPPRDNQRQQPRQPASRTSPDSNNRNSSGPRREMEGKVSQPRRSPMQRANNQAPQAVN